MYMTTKEPPRGKRSASSEVEEFFAKRLEREEKASRYAQTDEIIAQDTDEDENDEL